jgi:serine/threonine-protein kinase
MNPSRWQQVQALFEAALVLQPAQRDIFLNSACHDDPELLHEIKSLLTADSSADPFLRAYPNNPEARKAMRPQAKWRKAR